MSTAAATASTESSAEDSTLVGIDWVRSSVVSVLNEIFDPAEIAKGAAIAKLDGKKNKKQKKKKKHDDDAAEDEPKESQMSEDEREAIIQAAIAAAKPFSTVDAMVTPATKPEFGDYQCNAGELDPSPSVSLAVPVWSRSRFNDRFQCNGVIFS